MSTNSERGHGLLFCQMEPLPGCEAEFHEWYDHDDIPARLRIPGFTGARRYVARAGSPRFLAVYELAELDALRSSAYQELKRNPSTRTARMLSSVNGLTRFVCEELRDTGPRPAAPWLSVAAFAVPSVDEATFHRWYEGEHVPLLMRSALWWRIRRYRVTAGRGGPWTHLALHELASESATEAPELALACQTPLCRELASRPWFAESGRWLYELISISRATTWNSASRERVEVTDAT